MIVGDLELFLIELPAGDGAVRALLLRLVSESGVEGWGETRIAWHPNVLPARRKALLGAVSGCQVHDIESILSLDVLADRALACAVEMALWDLVAQAAGQPLCHLLGGVYRPSVPLAVRLPSGPPEAMAHWARVFSAQGIMAHTVVSAGALEADLKLLAALGEACPPQVQLRLDAERQYDVAGAARLCAQLEPGSVDFVLDPVPVDKLDHLGEIAGRARVPLAACADVRGPRDVMRLARGGALRTVLVDPARAGGLSAARRSAEVADAAGITPGVRIDRTSGVAIAASLQMAAATPAVAAALECGYPMLHDDVLVEPLRMVDGMLAVPLGPGLGVQVDRDKVDWYQVEA